MRNIKFGRFLSLMLAVIMIMSMVSAGALSVSAVQSRSLDLGDMDDFVGEEPDEEYTAKDANILKRMIAGDLEISKGTEEFERYDLNGDFALNAKDANTMKRIIAGEIVD